MSKYNISESEWKVMTCLWKEPNLTLKQISQNLKDTKWSYSTIRTLVTRLMEKGAIDADKSSSSNFKYFPIVQEKECKVQETKNFLTRVFNGSVSMMISTLANKKSFRQKKLQSLKKL